MTTNLCTKCHGKPADSYWDIPVWTKVSGGLTCHPQSYSANVTQNWTLHLRRHKAIQMTHEENNWGESCRRVRKAEYVIWQLKWQISDWLLRYLSLKRGFRNLEQNEGVSEDLLISVYHLLTVRFSICYFQFNAWIKWPVYKKVMLVFAITSGGKYNPGKTK